MIAGLLRRVGAIFVGVAAFAGALWWGMSMREARDVARIERDQARRKGERHRRVSEVRPVDANTEDVARWFEDEEGRDR